MAAHGGPKTRAGKKISSKNALKHGMTSTKLLCPEEQARCDYLEKMLREEYGPRTITEELYISKIASLQIRLVVGCGGYILRGVNRHVHISESLNPSSVSVILKKIHKNMSDDFNEKPLSGHSFRVGAALDMLEAGDRLERIMLKGGWKADSTAIKYLRNWQS